MRCVIQHLACIKYLLDTLHNNFVVFMSRIKFHSLFPVSRITGPDSAVLIRPLFQTNMKLVGPLLDLCWTSWLRPVWLNWSRKVRSRGWTSRLRCLSLTTRGRHFPEAERSNVSQKRTNSLIVALFTTWKISMEKTSSSLAAALKKFPALFFNIFYQFFHSKKPQSSSS